MNFIIGAGGVGSWLAPSLCMLVGKGNVCLVDGDTLEEKNLNRQLFTKAQIGHNKAWALASLYNCSCLGEFYSMGRFHITDRDWLLVCVDNHPARLAALNECDARGCSAIFAANETHSAEAFVYFRHWRNTGLDPRVYYPEILTSRDGDPMGEAIGCTGESQVSNPQLVSANFMAASLLQHLFVLWCLEAPELDEDTLPSLPYKLVANLSKLESFRVKDVPQIERTENAERETTNEEM